MSTERSAASCRAVLGYEWTGGGTERTVRCELPSGHEGPHERHEQPAAMTRAQRNQLRHLIDQAKRQQLDAHKPSPGRNQAARRATYRAYYQRNRKQILARRAASRAA